MKDYNKSTSWVRKGALFNIEIKQHIIPVHPVYNMGRGPFNWYLYAYVFKKHPLFDTFDIDQDAYQAVTDKMPFHGGCTYLEPSYRGSKISSIKVGCDYQHLDDDRFSHYETLNENPEIVIDAQELYQYMESTEAPSVAFAPESN